MTKTMQVTSVALGFVLGYLTCSFFRRKGIKVLRGAPYKFVMVVRADIPLTKNEIATHCSKAALECYKKTNFMSPETIDLWERNGQPKIVLKANGIKQITNIQQKVESMGLACIPVIHSQQSGVTAIGIGPGPEEIINQITGDLKLL